MIWSAYAPAVLKRSSWRASGQGCRWALTTPVIFALHACACCFVITCCGLCLVLQFGWESYGLLLDPGGTRVLLWWLYELLIVCVFVTGGYVGVHTWPSHHFLPARMVCGGLLLAHIPSTCR